MKIEVHEDVGGHARGGRCRRLWAKRDSQGRRRRALIGAGLGGLAGSMIGDGGGKLVAVGVGTMLGAIIGGETGKSLDRADKLALAQAQHEAWRTGHPGARRPGKTPTPEIPGKSCRSRPTSRLMVPTVVSSSRRSS